MSKLAHELRAAAQQSLAQARLAPPLRAVQKRQSAQELLRQARRQELSDHSNDVGRGNVTVSTFREYLRARVSSR